jgi:hypothetical protein
MTKIDKAILELLLEMFHANTGNAELQQILLDIEIWEGGSVRREASGDIWVTADNGAEEISRFLINLF